MSESLGFCFNHFFADDLAAVLASSIGIKCFTQCLDLEKKIKLFLENLHFYSALTSQPINVAKTVGRWSVRAISSSKFEISIGDNKIRWVNEFKYLGYWLTTKLSFATLINQSILKIRQLIGMINTIRVTGSSSIIWSPSVHMDVSLVHYKTKARTKSFLLYMFKKSVVLSVVIR